MQRWREHALDSVAAMYEDRFDLWGLAPGGRLLRRSVPARRARVRAPRPYQGTLVCAVAPLHAGHRRALAQEPRQCCVVPCGGRASVLAEGSAPAPQHGTAASACRDWLRKVQPGSAWSGLRHGGGAARAGAV